MENYKIIIPDIHQNLDRLKKIMSSDDVLNAQEIIFLGDYFDSFNYDFLTKETCNFLNSYIKDDKFTFLLGNHDAHYLYNVKEYICSGFTQEKKNIIKEFLDTNFYQKVKLFKYEKIAGKHFLFSHAGLHPSHTTVSLNEKLKTDSIGDYFDNLEAQVKMSCNLYMYHPLLGAGMDRGGKQRYGGITWQDWTTLETINGLNQIVGHSQYTKPQTYKTLDSQFGVTFDINLDTNLKYYGKLNIDTGDIDFMGGVDIV